MLALATAHVSVMAAWLTTWSVLLTRGRTAVASRGFAATVNRIGGAVLIALGLRTAATS